MKYRYEIGNDCHCICVRLVGSNRVQTIVTQSRSSTQILRTGPSARTCILATQAARKLYKRDPQSIKRCRMHNDGMMRRTCHMNEISKVSSRASLHRLYTRAQGNSPSFQKVLHIGELFAISGDSVSIVHTSLVGSIHAALDFLQST